LGGFVFRFIGHRPTIRSPTTRPPHDADSITTSEFNWQAGDTLIGNGNTRWRITAVIPGERVDEFVDGREIDEVLEVEPSDRG
jgi:hypothetical protein